MAHHTRPGQPRRRLFPRRRRECRDPGPRTQPRGRTRGSGSEGAITWNLAEVAFDYCLAGRWDESLAIHDAEIARIEAGAPHYLETQHRQSRSRIRLGRGDLAGALEDADRAVEAGREAGDPQALLPCLAETREGLARGGTWGGGRGAHLGDPRAESRAVAGLGVVDPPGVDRAHGAGPRRRSPGPGRREPSVGLGRARRGSGRRTTSPARRTSSRRWARRRTRRTRG